MTYVASLLHEFWGLDEKSYGHFLQFSEIFIKDWLSDYSKLKSKDKGEKRILVLNYEFPPLGGGAANATKYILREFSKDKDLVIDLVTSSVGGFKVEKFSSNVTIYYLDIGKTGDLHYQSNKNLLMYSWKAYWFCKKLIRKNNYSLCHAFFWNTMWIYRNEARFAVYCKPSR